MQISIGFPEPREVSSLPRLRLVQSGVLRTEAQRRHKPPRIRLPITPKILRGIHRVWFQSPQVYENIMLWAAACLCFFGFFRAGELTVPTEASYDPANHLSWGDVITDDIRNPTLLRVHLKKSKCDQVGKGVDVYIGRIVDDILCPVAAVLAFLAARGSAPGPLFCLPNQRPLTKARFVKGVRQALVGLGLPYDQFAGHSFRIGAATTAAQAGIEDSMICSLGRWNSTAFLTYIRIPRERLAPVSRQLALRN